MLNSNEALKNDILLDDRKNLTIGHKVIEGKRIGYPFIIALGSKIVENPPLFEMIDIINKKQVFLNEDETVKYIVDKMKK